MGREGEESIFNMAFAYLQRIDRLLYFCQEAATKQDVDAWLNYLRAVFRELSVKLKPEEKEEILGTKRTEQINLDNIKEEDATFRNLNKLVNNTLTRTNNKSKILFLLDELDMKVSAKLQKKGILLPSKDDPRYAVTKR